MRFGRFEVLERLGAGGMGEVFRARDHDLQRDVAVKFLPEQYASDPARLARFAQEARAASSLNHPNIVTIHEIGQTSGLPYIVMELVDGRTLRRVIRDRPLPASRVLEIGAQLADGLAKAHGAGIVHRDLKPENVMITNDGFVKILDFGLAKLRAGEAPGDGAPRPDEAETQVSPHTVAGVVLGTAGYMSPEQARGDAMDYRSDQFSLGIVLYELATGRKAFRGESVVQTMAAVIEQTPEPIANLRPDFPAPARWAIERCLAKEPRARYASTLDLAQELRSVREHLSDAGVGTPGRPRRAWVWERRRALRLVVGLCAIVLAVLAAPQVRQSVTRWLARAALPSEMRVAVLPITVAGTGDEDPTCCGGLLDYVAVRLADLSRYHSRVSVVPVAELVSSGVRSPSAARQALGATITVSISVHRVADSLLVSVSLADAEKVRQLAGESRTFPRSTFSPELVVNLVVPLLELQLAANQKAAWSQAASTVPEAGVLYAQALGQTPYQQAQSRLEEYDQARSLEQAIKLLNDAINLEPRYAAAHAALGEARIRLYRLTKDPSALDLAEQSARQALSIDNTRPAAWMTLGMARAQRGDLVEAEKSFTEAIARNPNGADIYRELGLAYQRVKLWDKAEAAYRRAVSLQPKSWSSHNYLGSFFFRRERYPEGEAEFRRALEFAPENARVWSNLGGLYLAQERWKDAEAALITAVRIHPYGPALSNLGYLQMHARRQYAEAAKTFAQAAAISPRDSRVWMNLGSASHWGGQKAGADAAYVRAVALLEEEQQVDPTNAQTLLSLAACHATLGNAARSRAYVSDALRLGIGEGDWTDVVAVFEDLGDRDAALGHLRQAFKAGVKPEELADDPTFDSLRKDPRYSAIVKALASNPDKGRR